MSISNLLFIDANIYLRFYDSKQSDFKKLMNSLIELRENIFITKQIVNEVNRNKLSVFKQSIDSYKKQIAINNISLPDHLDEAESPQISSWNKDRKSIEQLIETSNHKFDSIIKDVIGNISISQDIVSKKLTPITAKAETPNIETLNKAIKRKELGNPPGKREDPIGDELSWEQLILKANETDKIWLISGDSDYYTFHEKECYLNPLLYEELKNLNPQIEIKCFKGLADALREFNKTEEIKTLPKENDLSKISKDESSLNTRVFLTGAAIEFEPDTPIICSLCLQENNFSRMHFIDRLTGVSELRFVCNNCGSIYTR